MTIIECKYTIHTVNIQVSF